jgi:hypothetical protein
LIAFGCWDTRLTDLTKAVQRTAIDTVARGSPGRGGTTVKVIQEWHPGLASLMTDLSGHAPAGGLVASPEAWARLWNAWRGDADVPEVDFEKDLILVAAGPGPNIILVQELRLSDDGDLRFRWAITKRGAPVSSPKCCRSPARASGR